MITPETSNEEDILIVRNINKHFFVQDTITNKIIILDDLSFTIKKGKIVSIVGPSGCGKTTLLKIISGLLSPTSGEVLLNNKSISGPSKEMVLLFQEYNKSLLPWRNVADNVRLGLEARGITKEEQQNRVHRYLKIVGLEQVKEYYPWELSGGMQQRVALARALACEPAVLLADEPFGSLDALTRGKMEDELLELWSNLNLTILLVTHDIEEAVYLSDRIMVIGQRPAEIKKDIRVMLCRPRDQIETRSNRDFALLRVEIYKALLDMDE